MKILKNISPASFFIRRHVVYYSESLQPLGLCFWRVIWDSNGPKLRYFTQLAAIVKKRWKGVFQASLSASIECMPARYKAAISHNFLALIMGDGY